MEYKRCIRCVMDNMNDSHIVFDKNGFCSYCTEALKRKSIVYFPNETGKGKLSALIMKLKHEGKGKEYDCMMGISGGLDSSYLAMLGFKWGLRILAVHIDDGFDTEIAKKNIKNLCKACNVKLITVKPDEEQFNGLIRSFVLSGSPDLDTPQDNVLFATLHSFAKKYKIKYFLSGGNFALESILQPSFSSNAYDTKRIRYIHKKYGNMPIKKLHIMSNYQRVIDKFIYRFISVRPLNYIHYEREKAIKELKTFCEFQYYEAKHCENYLTKIIQLYWLPKKFGYDKRKSHYSSLIITHQLDRNTAIEKMKSPAYCISDMECDLEFVLSKLGIARHEFNKIVAEGRNVIPVKGSIGYRLVQKYFRYFIVRFKG